MSFRRKLLLMLAATVVVSTLAVSLAVAAIARGAFERQAAERSSAIAEQFTREFERSGQEVVERVQAIAHGEIARRMALDLERAGANPGVYLGAAEQAAAAQSLNFLEFVAADGSIISSAEFPARFGYRDEWASLLPKLGTQGAVLRRQPLPSGAALGLFAVRAISAGENPIFAVGGTRLDREFVSTLAVPGGTEISLYTQLDQLPTIDYFEFNGIFNQVKQTGARKDATITGSGFASQLSDYVTGIPLKGANGDVLAILMIATSRAELLQAERHIVSIALLIAGLGIFSAVMLSGWVAARVTRPVAQLAAGAEQVAAGNWDAHVDVNSGDELGQLAAAFNRMTSELASQRDRLVQAERVAAWRELARRLAHELKNPLFPLQITVENLVRARQLAPAEFEEVFRESTATLNTELKNLGAIVGRFSDFSKMPRPQLEPVRLNEVLQQAARLHGAQMQSTRRAPVLELQLSPQNPVVQADPTLLHRALSNLVLNALDAVPAERDGKITLRTFAAAGRAIVEVSDNGAGMAPEECERLFTPYYTTKQHGTGLGLAIVQSVVSDHGGKITVESSPGQGSTFRIELPLAEHISQPTDVNSA